MDTKAFRAWLGARGIAEKSVDTRVTSVRKIELAMAALGSPHGDLDAAYQGDRLHFLRGILSELRADAMAGGERYKALMPQSENPVNRLANFRYWLGLYGRFLEDKGGMGVSPRSDWAALEDMRGCFLDRVPDFISFTEKAGTYYETEREYKDVIRADIVAILEEGADDVLTGQKLVAALMPKDGPLLNWQGKAAIDKEHADLAPEYYRVITRLARSSTPIADALWESIQALETLRERGVVPLTKGEILSLTLTVAGMVHPTESAPFKISKAADLAKRLTDTQLFAGSSCERSQVEDWLALLRRIYLEMDRVWGWQPQDLIDVQGFAWVVLSDTWDLDLDEEPTGIQLFDGTGTSYEPVRQVNQKTNVAAFRVKAGGSNKTDDALEIEDVVELARAMLIDRRPVRIKPTAGGTPNYLTYGNKLVFYRLRADIAQALGLPQTNLPEKVPQKPAGEDAPMTNPTNIILYGPPGTGKTFATAEEAVRLCDGAAPGSREEIYERYRRLIDAKQVSFITFHQSFSYEDFVEGLRPTMGDDPVATPAFSLEPRKGVFREICSLAEQARKKKKGTSKFELGDRNIYKMSLGRAGAEDHIYEAAIQGSYIVLGWGGEHDWADSKYIDFDNVKDRWNEIEPGTSGNKGDIAQVWAFRGSMKTGDLVVISEGNFKFRAIGEIIGDYYYSPTGVGTYNHRRNVKWLLVLDEPLPVDAIYERSFSQVSCYKLRMQNLRREALERLLSGNEESGLPDQFVLVIDEINRANISKVFGELITLIEPDKRLGRSNELTVKLPYSGDIFGIPDNLHIVGTMNTADRSIALLDTALRRRFEFREVLPNPKLLGAASAATGLDLVALLEAINSRIEYYFDRDHQIGHAYLIGCKSREDVDLAMRNKIIPLLAEYFYEDWGRVASVLDDLQGTRFLNRTALKPPPGQEDDDGDGEQRLRWTVKTTFPTDAYDGFE